MLRRYAAFLLIPALLLVAGTSVQGGQTAAAKPAAPQAAQKPAPVPAPVAKGPRPDQFTFKPLVFTPPKVADYRTVLSNGLVVYIGEDHEIPWINASLLMRTGPFLEPKDKLGVAGMTAAVMRSGGTKTMTGEQINERMDFLAGNVSATNLSIHARHLDEGMKIWMDVLTNPAFPEDKLRRERDQALVGIRNRNRNLGSVAGRTWTKLIYGEDSPMAAEPTEAGTSGITRDDLAVWHREVLGRVERDPDRLGRLQEGGDDPEARGDVRQVGPGREGRAANPEGRAGGEGGRLHGAAAGAGEPGRHPDRTRRDDAGRPGRAGGRPDELHPGRRLVLVAHHQGGPHRQRPGVLDQFELLWRPALPGDVRGVLPDEELHRRLRVAAHARPDRGHARGRRVAGRPRLRQDGARRGVPGDVRVAVADADGPRAARGTTTGRATTTTRCARNTRR